MCGDYQTIYYKNHPLTPTPKNNFPKLRPFFFVCPQIRCRNGLSWTGPETNINEKADVTEKTRQKKKRNSCSVKKKKLVIV